jgi:hypothetical protein
MFRDPFHKLMGLGLIIVLIAKLLVEPRIPHVWITGNKFKDGQIKALVDDVVELANIKLAIRQMYYA